MAKTTIDEHASTEDLLRAISHTLTTGTSPTRANLALHLLGTRLGVDTFAFDGDETGEDRTALADSARQRRDRMSAGYYE